MALIRTNNDMWTVETSQPVRYTVRALDGVLDRTFSIPEDGSPDLDPLGRTRKGSPRRLVVVDREVMRLYGDRIRGFLDRHRVDYRFHTIDGGEKAKTMRSVLDLCRAMDAFGISRRSEYLIVFSGGVGRDVAGLAASLYRRGVPRIEFPTTLVGIIDASLGAKVGADFNGYKNRLGAFHAPLLTIVDRTFLSTVHRRRLSDGLGEVLKVATVLDRSLFDDLERHGARVLEERFQGYTQEGDVAALNIIDAAINGMLGDLHGNLWETALDKATFFGHSWSPALEMEALRRSRSWLLPWRRRPELLHGEAVALDMALSAVLARGRRLLRDDECERVLTAAESLGLPAWNSLLGNERILEHGLADTVRHRDGRQLIPLPDGIGNVTFVDDIVNSEVAEAVDHLARRACGGIRAGQSDVVAYNASRAG